MFRKFLSGLSMSSILLVSSSLILAKSKGDWSLVESLVNEEVAVKTKGGMKYGIIKSVGADILVLRLAGKKTMTQDEATIKEDEIKKIWRALLFVNSRNTGKGALIGAGVGTVGLGVPVFAQGSDDGLHGAGLFIGAVGGAAVGGVVGFFTKKKHKKRDLVYKN